MDSAHYAHRLDIIEEYRFMRSFGMSAKRACDAVRLSPRTLIRYHQSLRIPVPADLYRAENNPYGGAA